MARGDATRDQGNKLDKVHTELVRHTKDLRNEVDKLDGILSEKIIESLMSNIEMLESELDNVSTIYSELDDVADELDSDESDDESARRELEKSLATAEELESENDDLSAEAD